MHTSTTSTGRLDPWNSQALQDATQGRWHPSAPEGDIQRIVTDSRAAGIGDAFLALKGERFDAHDFVANVAKQGAKCVIVEREIAGIDIPQLVVADGRLALAALGQYRRQQCQDLKVVALTGSSGKTTTKEMLASIFAQLGETLVTRGNLNNDLGVPMMLLELRQDHRYAVFELGANHQGEIDYTAKLVQPQVAGVINIGTAHLGEFGGRGGICRAKSEIYSHIQVNGVAIVPQQDDFTVQLTDVAKHQPQLKAILSFGKGGDVYAKNIQLNAQSSQFDLVTPQGEIQIDLPFAGLHNVHNAEAAASFALGLDIDLKAIQTGLKQATNAKGRLNFIQKNQYTLIDDTYNANPNSMRAAADVLTQQQGLKVMVIGDIGELGDESQREHFALGQALSSKPLDLIISVGEFAQDVKQGADAEHVHAFNNQADALVFLQDWLNTQPNQAISFLFKGSRYTHMENLLHALLESL
ncbi:MULTISPECIES: UDP-N-acetylmuramoyl-tripeptide--D-alanyl-D-alanine ligase [unclassified Acinetobacter]|uniref:UDP-N-acetylmuramoyl-tripeptide--D-alanyl-D- alanine ligase n=1 Tax=unclassified Acinetobacter TaxID=196816 RepID=UPI0035B80B3C